MNVMEDTRNRVKSNAAGIDVGSRSSISNVVHGLLVFSGRSPRRANNWWDVSIFMSGQITELRVPGLSYPSSRTPSISPQR